MRFRCCCCIGNWCWWHGFAFAEKLNTRVCGLRVYATRYSTKRMEKALSVFFSFLINSIMPIRSFYQLIPVDGELVIGERVIIMALNRWWEWIWHNEQCWLLPKNGKCFRSATHFIHCHSIVSLLASILVAVKSERTYTGLSRLTI